MFDKQVSEECEFTAAIQSYHADLSRYCRMMTGTPWDADDLLQETLIKAFKSGSVLENHPAPKAFLFRVATNTWIDHCRRNKVPEDTYEDEQFANGNDKYEFEVREALETLIYRLPPRQVAIVLLMDVFGFSAKSAAAMMEVTEGAVKAALHRARSTLKKVKIEEKREQILLKSKSAAELVEIFLEAFQQHDAVAVSRAYLSLQDHGVEVKRVSSGKILSFQFQDPDGNVFTVTAKA
ncbi:MAG TPA: sigma-70 family RNA polymerase sigma factor [Bacillales bacterium]|nr:sigma-70 family RNA polymerase sigma factor [Bacillales bacterium]